MEYLDLRNLSKELYKLRERKEVLDDEELDRLNDLLELEKHFDGDLDKASKNEPTLILKADWVNHCKDLADDCGYLTYNSPLENYIDWERWADDMKQDYDEVEFGGETYLYRYD